jgi:general secretion pathway protein G
MRANGLKREAARSGFTLLELLIVVGILVMLAALAMPSFMGSQKQAQIDAAKTQVAAIESATKLYQASAGTFPTTEQGIKALAEKPEEDPVPKKWAGPYMEDANILDPWGREYQYAYPGEHNEKKKPDVWSLGPDPEDDSDNIGNWKSEEETGDEGSSAKRK